MSTLTEFNLSEILDRKEDLLPVLKQYIRKSSGMVVLQHPLVYSVPYTEQMNALLNTQYNVRLEFIQKLKDEKKWESYILMHERPYRFEIFNEIKGSLSNQEYWDILSSLWTDSENIWQYHWLIEQLLNSSRPDKQYFMDKESQDLFALLPDEFTVYRGHHYHNKKGWSWTLSYEIGSWFAEKLKRRKQASVVKGIVSKKDIIGVILGRNEAEIVVSPQFVRNIKSVLSFQKNKQLAYFRQLALEQFKLTGFSLHGPSHWNQVEMNGIALCKETPGANNLVCRLFAIFHDCKRKDENEDPDHGVRAAEYVESISHLLELKSDDFQSLKYACAKHNSGETTTDPTIGVCWDSDRLALLRVGTITDPKYLSTEVAKRKMYCVK